MSDVVVLNVPQVAGALEKYPNIARPAYETAAKAAMLDTIPAVALYPPKPPSSEYRRTGLLGREWNVKAIEYDMQLTHFSASLRNKTPYGEYVQGEAQARIHRGRWWKVDDIVKARSERIEEFFEAAARKIEREIDKVTS